MEKIRVFVDGKPLLEYKGNMSELGIPRTLDVPVRRFLMLGTSKSSYRIRKLEITSPKLAIEPPFQAGWTELEYQLDGVKGPFVIKDVQGKVKVDPLKRTGAATIRVTSSSPGPNQFEFVVEEVNSGRTTRAKGILFSGDSARINLLELLDLERDAIHGTWSFAKGVLECKPKILARVQIPFVPPQEYDLTLVAKRKTGKEMLGIGLTSLKIRSFFLIDSHESRCGFSLNDGTRAFNNKTTRYDHSVFADGKEHTILCRVCKDKIIFLHDGKLLNKFEGDLSQLRIPPAWNVFDPRYLIVGTWDSTYAISKLEISRPKLAVEP